MTIDENDVSISWALETIRENKSDGIDRAVEILLNADDAGTESALLDILMNHNDDLEVSGNASRILVEREPERDPSFLLDHFSADGVDTLPKPMRWLQTRMSGDVFYGYIFYQFGFPRLRRINPIEVYSRLLEQRFRGARAVAAIALGDSADLDALEPLAKALSDPSAEVRQQAADSVRRLRHAAVAGLPKSHPVYEQLINCLSDTRRKVRLAAARALGSAGYSQALEDHRKELHWWAWRRKKDIDNVMRGKIPSLRKIWPGDKTI